MAYNKAKEEKKWRLWKEAEENQLRNLGVDGDDIEKLRIHDWAIFNSDRRYYQRVQENKLCSERGAAMRKKYYEDAKENAAFERCADVITSLILKYGPALKQKWNLNEWIRNIQAESLWKDIACKRYQRYFICMKNMKSVPT